MRRAGAQGGCAGRVRRAGARTPLKEKLGSWPPSKRLSPSWSSSLDLLPPTIGGARPGGARPGGTPMGGGGSAVMDEDDEEACAISRRYAELLRVILGGAIASPLTSRLSAGGITGPSDLPSDSAASLPSSLRVSSSLLSVVWPSSSKKDMFSMLRLFRTIGGCGTAASGAACATGWVLSLSSSCKFSTLVLERVRRIAGGPAGAITVCAGGCTRRGSRAEGQRRSGWVGCVGEAREGVTGAESGGAEEEWVGCVGGARQRVTGAERTGTYTPNWFVIVTLGGPIAMFGPPPSFARHTCPRFGCPHAWQRFLDTTPASRCFRPFSILCQRFLTEETVRPGSRRTILLHMGPSWLCISRMIVSSSGDHACMFSCLPPGIAAFSLAGHTCWECVSACAASHAAAPGAKEEALPADDTSAYTCKSGRIDAVIYLPCKFRCERELHPLTLRPNPHTMSLTSDDVARMKVPELQAALEERDLDTTGRKAVLVERLLEAVASPSVGEGTSKKKAESPVEDPPAKKAKGKAVAKEEAAAPAEVAANEGKAADPSAAAPATPSSPGIGVRSRPVPAVPSLPPLSATRGSARRGLAREARRASSEPVRRWTLAGAAGAAGVAGTA